jgi:hypothetical protein
MSPDSFEQKLSIMKTSNSKKLNKQITTICDYSLSPVNNGLGNTDNPTGTDPTNTIVTTITTINTHLSNQKLSL